MMQANSKANMSVEEGIESLRKDLVNDIGSRCDRRDVVEWLAEVSWSVGRAAANFNARQIEINRSAKQEELVRGFAAKKIARGLVAERSQSVVSANRGRRMAALPNGRYKSNIGTPKMKLSGSKIGVVNVVSGIKSAVAGALSSA
jgi:hypothetical protein